MADRLPAGPYRTFKLDTGATVPYYIVPFDKTGSCTGPQTRERLLEDIQTHPYTHIFIFSHGWNNDWSVATRRYDDFISGFIGLRKKINHPYPQEYRPLLIGTFWPSTALVFTENERGPDIAGTVSSAEDEAIGEAQFELEEIVNELQLDRIDRGLFYQLANRSELTPTEALDLARLVQPLYREDDEIHLPAISTPERIVEIWGAVPQAPYNKERIAVNHVLPSGALEPQMAGIQEPAMAGIKDLAVLLDPRTIIRDLTVMQMKDRAGVVGAGGVHDLIVAVLCNNRNAQLHLVGHSYGCKVMLSALCGGASSLPRNVNSLLLLQPAVSHLCFAPELDGSDRKGGYCRAPEQVDKPILATFSKHDIPLTRLFHLALRRHVDLGDAQIAALATGPEPPVPSIYAALGGFGPRQSGQKIMDMAGPAQDYHLPARYKIFGLRGDDFISGHGDISNEATWWLLFWQVFVSR